MYINTLFTNDERLFVVIARTAYLEKKCYRCFKKLKGHKRCKNSYCRMLLHSKECMHCIEENVEFNPYPWKGAKPKKFDNYNKEEYI